MAGRLGPFASPLRAGGALDPRGRLARARHALAALGLGACLLSCATRTEIVLVVQAEEDLAGRLTSVSIVIEEPSAEPLDPVLAPSFPLTLGVEHAGGMGRLSVRVEGRGDGDLVLASARASMAFAPGRRQMLYVELSDRCAAGCGAEDSCFRGVCLPSARGECAVVDALIEGRLAQDADEACLGAVGPPPTGYVSVAVGPQTSCAASAEGEALCWGSNADAVLGEGAPPWSSRPLRIAGLSEVVEVGVGAEHACARTGDGQVRCWGDNELGQLGLPDDSPAESATPVEVALGAGERATQLGVGAAFACALTSGGGVYCWGDDEHGQTGRFERTDGVTRVEGITASPEGLIAGSTHACTWDTDGNVCCWGQNSWGGLGTGTASPAADEAQCTAGLAGEGQRVVGMAAGFGHTCLVTDRGRVRCWGRNNGAAVRVPSSDQELVPVDVLPERAFSAVAAGDYFTCAVEMGTGRRFCWGDNEFDVLALEGPGADDDAAPTPGVEETAYVALDGADEAACGITVGGEVHCWGYDVWGRVGRGSDVIQTQPTPVALEGGRHDLAAGAFVTCLRERDGEEPITGCWGSGEEGRRGPGGDTSTALLSVLMRVPANFTALGAAHEAHLCGIVGGEPRCWGRNADGQVSVDLAEGSTGNPVLAFRPDAGRVLDAVATGGTHSCAYSSADASLTCWGRNAESQLGRTDLPSPGPLSFVLDPPLAVVDDARGQLGLFLGDRHTCVLLEGGVVQCWGENDEGQSSPAAEAEPVGAPTVVTVEDLTPTLLATGADFTCAGSSDRVVCWGSMARLTSDGAASLDEVALGNSGILGLTAGAQHACAWTEDTIHCWGSNSHGQVGAAALGSRPIPVSFGLPGGLEVRQVVAGRDHTCALGVAVGGADALFCWGSDHLFQLGSGRPVVWPSPGPIREP